MADVESYVDPALDRVLSALLNGDALLNRKYGAWRLELANLKVSEGIVKRLFKGSKPRMRDYEGRYILNHYGIAFALSRLPKRKLGDKLPSEIGMHVQQRFAFRIVLAVRLRAELQRGNSNTNALILEASAKAVKYVRKNYPPPIIKYPRTKGIFHPAVPTAAEADPKLDTRMYGNQFRRREFLRPRIKVQHKQ